MRVAKILLKPLELYSALNETEAGKAGIDRTADRMSLASGRSQKASDKHCITVQLYMSRTDGLGTFRHVRCRGNEHVAVFATVAEYVALDIRFNVRTNVLTPRDLEDLGVANRTMP